MTVTHHSVPEPVRATTPIQLSGHFVEGLGDQAVPYAEALVGVAGLVGTVDRAQLADELSAVQDRFGVPSPPMEFKALIEIMLGAGGYVSIVTENTLLAGNRNYGGEGEPVHSDPESEQRAIYS